MINTRIDNNVIKISSVHGGKQKRQKVIPNEPSLCLCFDTRVKEMNEAPDLVNVWSQEILSAVLWQYKIPATTLWTQLCDVVTIVNRSQDTVKEN